jgi:hypothetical protein
MRVSRAAAGPQLQGVLTAVVGTAGSLPAFLVLGPPPVPARAILAVVLAAAQYGLFMRRYGWAYAVTLLVVAAFGLVTGLPVAAWLAGFAAGMLTKARWLRSWEQAAGVHERRPMNVAGDPGNDPYRHGPRRGGSASERRRPQVLA